MTAKPDKDDLLFLPLGGAGEIGMNLNLFRQDGKWLMVDCGVMFGDETTPGIDVITPDISFIRERRDDLVGLVLTHAHEDHVGAVQYLWPQLQCPIYATGFTASVLRRKLAEERLEDRPVIHQVPQGSRFPVGPFDIEFITLTHSIPEPNAVVIHTAHGPILHTGDWKFDPEPLIGPVSDEEALRKLGDEGLLALVGDSTNVFREGTAGSEADVRTSLIELVGKYDRRVAIASFASNVARLETIAKVAKANGRHAALVGRSLWRMYDAAKENGYLRDIPPFLPEEEVMELPPERILMACTGSQGEPRAALSRIAAGSHPNVELEEGDAVIFSSRIIPGNEIAIGKLQNALIGKGVEVVTERDAFVHVSGHPARDELARMYQLTRPRVAIPVHGELRHMVEHAKLAESCQVPHTVIAPNGSMVRLAPGNAEVIDKVPTGRWAVDGPTIIPLSGETLRERRQMQYNGAVFVSVVLDAKGKLAAEPETTLLGLAETDEDYDELCDMIAGAAEDAITDLSAKKRADDATVHEAVRRAARRVAKAATGKRPPTEIHLSRV